jgi:hypothetical protein
VISPSMMMLVSRTNFLFIKWLTSITAIYKAFLIKITIEQ